MSTCGSRALADATRAAIVAGTHALFGRADLRLRDGEALEIGTTRLLAIETPGHTPESVSYAVYPHNAGGLRWGVLTACVGDLEQNLPAVGKDARLVVHCSVGHRSGIAAIILRRLGYTNVYNMLGGMKVWQALGRPIERR